MAQQTFQQIGERYDGDIKWDGAVLAPNGFIYGIPSSASKILKIDPSSDATSLVGDDLGGEEWKWWGGVYGNNGCIYGIPYNAKFILQFQIENEEIDRIMDQDPILESIYKFSGGVLSSSNCIYFIPYNHNKVVKFVPSTGSLTEVGDDLGYGEMKYNGGVLGGDGNIYCVPYNAKQVLKINTSDDTTSFVDNKYPGDFKWRRGILGKNGRIYGCPSHADQILEINIEKQTTNLVGPDLGSDYGKWIGFVAGIDGTLYGTPFHSNNVLCFNPEQNTLILLPLNKANGNRAEWSIGIQVKENIYFIPFDRQKVLEFNPPHKHKRLQSLAPDSETGKDLLGRKRTMHTLADVLARKDQELPLVLAILGLWGSGKTFCINQLMQRLFEIQKTDLSGHDIDSFPFAGHMYFIKLNAWSFHETDQWSSIMVSIFQQLSDQFRFEVMLKGKSNKQKLSKTETLGKLYDITKKFKASVDDNNVEEMHKLAEKAFQLMELPDRSNQLKRMAERSDEYRKQRIKVFLVENILNFLISEKLEMQTSPGKCDEGFIDAIDEVVLEIDESFQYKKEAKVEFLFKDFCFAFRGSCYSVKTFLKNKCDFVVKFMKIFCIHCRDFFRFCMSIFVTRGVDYFYSVGRDRIERMQLQEHLLEDTHTQEVLDEVAPPQDTNDNSVILKGGFSLMEIIEDMNSNDLENLLNNHEKVYEKVKSFQKRGTATEMLRELINETYNDDKQLLEEKQKKLKEKKKKIIWKLSCMNVVEIENKLISSIYEEIRGYDENVPDSFDEAWKTLNFCGKIREFWKVKTGVIWWFIGAALGTLAAYVVFKYRAELKDIRNEFQALLLSPLVTFTVPLFGKVARFSNVRRNARDTVTHAFSSSDQIMSEIVDLETSDQDFAELKQLEKEVNSLKDSVWLNEGDELHEVISKRLGKYEDKLGVVHQAQKDLKALSNAMLKKDNQKKYFPRGEPRIFLFIDDLDRCSPDKAVEVLEAIQLLLSTKLFATMVTMDMRYMERCLEQNGEYKGILQENGCPSGLHYLEKILQLAYRVPHIMKKEEMKTYLKGQLDNDETDQVANNKQGNRKRAKDQGRNTIGSQQAGPQVNTAVDDEGKQFNPAVETPPSIEKKDKVDTPENNSTLFLENVRYDEDEIDFVAEACFVANTIPRSTKRILSSFKILKEIWTNSPNDPGQKATKACIVLLAICASGDMRVRVGMKKAFWKLEQDHELPRPSFFGDTTFMSFWEEEKEFLLQGEEELPRPIQKLMAKYLSLPWNDWKDYFWQARAFSFVGDYAQTSSDQIDYMSKAVELK